MKILTVLLVLLSPAAATAADTAKPLCEKDLTLAVQKMSGPRMRIADDGQGGNARSVASSELALPAVAGPPSSNNYRRVCDANGRHFWISNHAVILAVTDAPQKAVAPKCVDNAYATRGFKKCSGN